MLSFEQSVRDSLWIVLFDDVSLLTSTASMSVSPSVDYGPITQSANGEIVLKCIIRTITL